MGRGRGARSHQSTGTPARGSAGSRVLTPRSPLSAPQLRDWAQELRAGEADDLVDALLSASGHARPAREQLRLAGLAFAASQPAVRTGATQVALGDDYTASLQWTVTSDDAGVALALDALLSRGEHRLGSFEVTTARGWSAENDELLVASDALRELGRRLERA